MSRHFSFPSLFFSLFDSIVFSVSLDFPSQLKFYWYLPPCWALPSITFYSSISTAIIQGPPVVVWMSNVSHGLINLNIWFSAGGTAWGGGAAWLKKVIGGGFWGWALGGLWGAHTASSHFHFAPSAWCLWLKMWSLPPVATAGCHASPQSCGLSSGIRSENKPSSVCCPWSSQQQGRNPSTSSASLLRSPGSHQFLRLRLPFLVFLSSLVRAYH